MSGYTKTQMFVFGAVVVLFVAVVIPAFFRKPKTTVIRPEYTPSQFGSNPNPRRTPQEKPAATKEKGWAATLVPYYALGVFGYVLYIMYRINRKKPTTTSQTQHFSKIMSPLASNGSRRKGGNQQTKITSYELNQLEEKLNESEKAVERILESANRVIAEVYQREMEADESDSTLSDDAASYEELPKITEVEDDYDSTSSDSTTDDDESTSCHKDGYDTYSYSDDTETSSSENEHSPQCEKMPKHAEEKVKNELQTANFIEEVVKEDGESQQNLESELKATTKSALVAEENQKLLSTTKDVMKAMSEIRTYIKEHK
uniref:Protein RIC-3-like n=1 Tax=Phallusia mammillata TaxID=59560 RepID=A0A6F9DRF3_9ASCI|nr:protein RIC-3-like [Phallusia mammillata]